MNLFRLTVAIGVLSVGGLNGSTAAVLVDSAQAAL
jgi:hypothetical protein